MNPKRVADSSTSKRRRISHLKQGPNHDDENGQDKNSSTLGEASSSDSGTENPASALNSQCPEDNRLEFFTASSNDVSEDEGSSRIKEKHDDNPNDENADKPVDENANIPNGAVLETNLMADTVNTNNNNDGIENPSRLDESNNSTTEHQVIKKEECSDLVKELRVKIPNMTIKIINPCGPIRKEKHLEPIVEEEATFYGLPLTVKTLLKQHRGITKLYDWQIKWLQLPSIDMRRNLIYSLPTSGGKTLVAEILMLREVLNRKKNVLFVLPYVALAHEKLWGLMPFASELNFLVEEYVGGKGRLPPLKRRNKKSIYIATIEKGLMLIRHLIEQKRLDEIGLVVVDELHLICEKGRGAVLESLLTTIMFADSNIHIVGMSATMGDITDLARYLRADVMQNHFRPVELVEYVKIGNMLHRLFWSEGKLTVKTHKKLSFNCTSEGKAKDPDMLAGIVMEGLPESSCLIFCPTKRNCEVVANMLCKLLKMTMVRHRLNERHELELALRAEGSTGDLRRVVRCGLAFHHAGLAAAERYLLEQAFRAGALSVLCCTSTLAAGVNLPAQRVVIRSPFQGREFLTLPTYRQMAGRAGRPGFTTKGESILMCSEQEWPPLMAVLGGGLPAARSAAAGASLLELALSGVALRLAPTPAALQALLRRSMLAVQQGDSPPLDVEMSCYDVIHTLLKAGAIEVNEVQDDLLLPDETFSENSDLVVTKLGRAATQGGLDIAIAIRLHQDLELAARSMVMMGSLHLLYLVTPYDMHEIKPDYRLYYNLYTNLSEEGVRTAAVLGITEGNAVKMMTGKPINNVPKDVLCRFYTALILHDLWKHESRPVVAQKFAVSRGLLQSLLARAAAFASSAHRFCAELEHLWPFRALLAGLLPLMHGVDLDGKSG